MCTFFANGAKVVQPDIKHSEDWLHAIPYFLGGLTFGSFSFTKMLGLDLL